MVTEYCLCANDLPTLITDVMGRLVDLLKVWHWFNMLHYKCVFVITVFQYSYLSAGIRSRCC